MMIKDVRLLHIGVDMTSYPRISVDSSFLPTSYLDVGLSSYVLLPATANTSDIQHRAVHTLPKSRCGLCFSTTSRVYILTGDLNALILPELPPAAFGKLFTVLVRRCEISQMAVCVHHVNLISHFSKEIPINFISSVLSSIIVL